MEGSHQQRFDRRGSMPISNATDTTLLPQEIESHRWDRALESSQRALHQSMNSPAYREFHDNTTSVWSRGPQELQGSSGAAKRGCGGDSGAQSPFSDTTVKLSHGYKQHNGLYTMPNIAVASPKTHAAQYSNNSEPEMLPYPHQQSFAGIAVDSPLQPHFGNPIHTPSKHAAYALPPGWTPPMHMRNETLFDFTGSLHNSSMATFGDSSLHQSAFSIPLNSPKDFHVRRRTNLHQSRLSVGASSLPDVSSPLSPGRVKGEVHKGDDGDVLLSSIPNGSAHQGHKVQYGRRKEDKRQMKDEWQSTPAPQSPTVQRYASTGWTSTPAFDVYPRRAHIDDEGNLTFGRPDPTNGIGHTRKHTDPFVDNQPTQHSLPYVSTRMSGTSTPFHPPSWLSIHPPRELFTAEWPKSAPAAVGSAVPHNPEYSPSAFRPVSRGRSPRRSNLPIPPPPLSIIQGQYQHTPEARALLDARKPVREAWIRTEATKIAQLARLRHVAERRFQETHSKKDHEVWQKSEAAYADATNLEKRQEERRNLFLQEKRMTALKTDNAKDMSAASRDAVGTDGEEKLLGFRMALMERECADVKTDEDEAAITVEMLATLSLEEKKALRQHLVTRLERKS